MPRRFERATVLLLLLSSAFWLPIVPPDWGGSLRARCTDLVQPVLQAVQWTRQGASRIFSGLVGVFSAEEENRILRSRLEALKAHEAVHRQLFQENARLRELLGFRTRSPWRVVPAEVIGRETGPWSRSMLVNRGSRDGVRRGMAVVTAVGLVGRVSETGVSSSRVTLLTDPHFRVAAAVGSPALRDFSGQKLQGSPTTALGPVAAVISESRLFALCVGTGRGGCVLTYLPLEAAVGEGENVGTAGGRSFAPEGIPIGTVRRLFQDSSRMFQTAQLTPAVDPGRVEEVLIVWPHPLSSDSSDS